MIEFEGKTAKSIANELLRTGCDAFGGYEVVLSQLAASGLSAYSKAQIRQRLSSVYGEISDVKQPRLAPLPNEVADKIKLAHSHKVGNGVAYNVARLEATYEALEKYGEVYDKNGIVAVFGYKNYNSFMGCRRFQLKKQNN